MFLPAAEPGDALAPSQTMLGAFDLQPRQPWQLAGELRVSLMAEELVTFTVPCPQGHQTNRISCADLLRTVHKERSELTHTLILAGICQSTCGFAIQVNDASHSGAK